MSEELYKDIMERETKSVINTWNILQFFITQENANYNASWGRILLSDMVMLGFTKWLTSTKGIWAEWPCVISK